MDTYSVFKLQRTINLIVICFRNVHDKIDEAQKAGAMYSITVINMHIYIYIYLVCTLIFLMTIDHTMQTYSINISIVNWLSS